MICFAKLGNGEGFALDCFTAELTILCGAGVDTKHFHCAVLCFDSSILECFTAELTILRGAGVNTKDFHRVVLYFDSSVQFSRVPQWDMAHDPAIE